VCERLSAIVTTLRVLQWAASPGVSAPPRGDLGEVEQLTKPQPQLRGALSELLRLTSARLRLPVPPLGDNRSADCEAC